ncbi:unnamed protein product [Clavelina lepadiformis]|uniref:PPPDE domain-containing protein n=1 Tax=Clavelina lepadiformis TaxID=159417 RepID=A0ABP0H4J0_CLALP
MSNETPDTYNVNNWITCSLSMEFAWSFYNDVMEHTDLVLFFNGMAVLVVGYGANLRKGLKIILFVSSAVSVALFRQCLSFETGANVTIQFLRVAHFQDIISPHCSKYSYVFILLCLTSKRMSSETPDTYNVNNWITNSSTMEFAWSVNNDMMEHTDLVLFFNGMPVFIVGYGANLRKGLKSIPFVSSAVSVSLFRQCPSFETAANVTAQLLSKLLLNAKIRVGLFDSKSFIIKGKLMKLNISTSEGKQRAKQLMEIISTTDLGDYQLLHNNCRDFIIAVAKLLKEEAEFTEDGWFQFESEMQSLRSIDQLKFEGGIREAPGLFRRIISFFFRKHSKE